MTPKQPNMNEMMRQLQRVQADMAKAQEELKSETVEASAGGGVVKVRASGSMEFESVTIAKDAVDPDDVELLEDLVLAALHDLSQRVADAARSAMGGMDLGGIGDLLGGLGLDAGPEPPAP